MPDLPSDLPIGAGPLYDPVAQDPLLIPTGGLAVPEWILEDFITVVNRASSDKPVVLQFHGVPDLAHPGCSTDPEKFKAFMAYLRAQDFQVVCLSDLAKRFDVSRRSPDPLSQQRFFR